jgi:hypothetical protein
VLGGRRIRNNLGSGLLLAASVLLFLVVAEDATRLADELPLVDLPLPKASDAIGLDTTVHRIAWPSIPANDSPETGHG